MKGNALLRVVLSYEVMIFACCSFANAPDICLGYNTEQPGDKGEYLLCEKPDEKAHNTSSSITTKETESIPNRVQASESSLVRTDETSIQRGKDLYEKLCRKCHDAYSMQTTFGPGLQDILKNALLPSSKKPATPLNILNQLNDPADKMPSFHFLSEEEKLSIIAFLNTL